MALYFSRTEISFTRLHRLVSPDLHRPKTLRFRLSRIAVSLAFGAFLLFPVFLTGAVLRIFYADAGLGFAHRTSLFVGLSFVVATLSIVLASCTSWGLVSLQQTSKAEIRKGIRERDRDFFEELDDFIEFAVEPADSGARAMA